MTCAYSYIFKLNPLYTIWQVFSTAKRIQDIKIHDYATENRPSPKISKFSQNNHYLTLNGAFLDDETCAENTGDGQCNVYISADSTWTVTGNSTITNLYNEGKIVDESGKTITIKGSDGTVYVQGNSNLIITVETYGTNADFSNAAQADSWSNYEVEKPEELL